MEMSWW